MPGKRRDELTTMLDGEYQRRHEPNFSISQSLSQHINIHGLRAYWPLIDAAPGVNYYDLGGQSRTLTATGNVFVREWATAQNHIGCAYFSGAQYLSRADAGFDVVGNETQYTAAYRGLTLGGWFQFAGAAAAIEMLMSKYNDGGANQEAYALYRLATGELRFNVSTDGFTNVIATTTATYAANTSYHVVARFDPSTELAVFVNGEKVASTVAGIPATLWTSTANFAIGASFTAGAAGNYFTGRARDCFVSANYLEDVYIRMLYQQTRAMFGA